MTAATITATTTSQQREEFAAGLKVASQLADQAVQALMDKGDTPEFDGALKASNQIAAKANAAQLAIDDAHLMTEEQIEIYLSARGAN